MADITSRLSTALADRYTIERELGAGGMATVYLAEDLKHDRKVAVKVQTFRESYSLCRGNKYRGNKCVCPAMVPHWRLGPWQVSVSGSTFGERCNSWRVIKKKERQLRTKSRFDLPALLPPFLFLLAA